MTPEQMVRIVVAFSAGSMTDVLARSVGEKLALRWNRQVIVENRPGLAGTASVTKATRDGYTLMLTSNGHTVIGHLRRAHGASLQDSAHTAEVSGLAREPSEGV